ncbi:MAG: putative sugar O-methyltransferase [Thalassobaculum sp.]|uniref:putative sugar O-methyltransferase n=1 Tax=Thalassobaculum sp. TaxID=2022740 RepID=UPI0032EBCD3E
MYAQAKKFEARSDKSVHWNVFPSDFARTFEHADAWPRLLRNGISAGFNDDTVLVPDRWERRKKHDYGDLVPRHDDDENYTRQTAGMFRLCAQRLKLNVVQTLLNTETGSPRLATFEVKVQGPNGVEAMRFSASGHDLSLVYACGRLIQTIRSNEKVMERVQANPTIVEIGGGFGELSAKVKRASGKMRCVIFDLPEPSAVQLYYLRSRWPGKTIYTIQDFHRRGLRIFDDPFDFLLLPPAFIKLVPAGWPSVYVNMRSFQEMRWLSVADYFVEIQRSMPKGGLFYCVNRLLKRIGAQDIAYDRFPFDDRWRPISTDTVPFQSHIREGLFERT